MLSQIELDNRDLSAAVAVRLKSLCGHRNDHARFLNTLSLLEHLGSRKIMTSPAARAPGQDILKHLAEETRHAFFFKRAAEKVYGATLGYDEKDLAAAPFARAYLNRLDAHISRTLGPQAPAALSYLYMSLIVELRAVWFYRLYHDVLAKSGLALSLRSVLAEEEQHLDAMFETSGELDPQHERNVARFRVYEEKLFAKLWRRLESAIG